MRAPATPRGHDGGMSSVFVRIIEGSIPGSFCWADEICVCFATIAPITPGHMLVVPRAEIPQFTDLDDDVLGHLAVVAKRVGQAQRRAFAAPRAALIVAGFEVPHTHIHVLPAWDEGAISFANARPASAESLRDTTERVRAALRDLGHGAHVPARVDSPALG